MRRWGTFLFGVFVGGLLIYGVLNYHVIQARDGTHLVPKVNAQLASTYVDIREFTPRDWIDHPEILEALHLAKRDDLLKMAASDAANNAIDRLLGPAPARR
jgi:hypothetical protein